MSNGGGNGENTDEQTLSRANNCCILIPWGEVPCLWGHNTTPKNRPLCLCTPLFILAPTFCSPRLLFSPRLPSPSVVAWPGNSKQEMVCLSDFSFPAALFVRLVPEDLLNTTHKAGENLNFGINKQNEIAFSLVVEYQARIEFVLTTLWVGPGIDTECFWPQLLGGATVY